MSAHPQKLDFGESIVPLTGTDAFFLDTNMLIAYLYEKDEKHLPCFCFITYLIKNEVILCVSEIVIVELLNTFARVLYIDDKIQEHIINQGQITSNREYKRLFNKFKGMWSSQIIKMQPQILMHYNNIASKEIQSFIKNTLLIESSDQIIDDMLQYVSSFPQASADATIVSTAINFGCQYLISIDKDMNQVQNIDVISTVHKNDQFTLEDMMKKLGIVEYLFSEMGESDFKSKFPDITVPVSQS